MARETLEARGISVAFPGVKALDRVDFRVEAGSIHALLGANGAGKSTLMKVLAGASPGYEGQVLRNGSPIALRSPSDAAAQGIRAVYQEVDTALVPSLSVAENILLDRLAGPERIPLLVDWKGLRRKAGEILERLHISLDLSGPAGALPLAQKQMVLIARALSGRGRFLLLDEPTASLSSAETEELFRLCRKLAREEGMAIVFVSHRLYEVTQICDAYSVLRNGVMVGGAPVTPETTAQEMMEKMLGHGPEALAYRRKRRPVGKDVLAAKHLSSADGSVKNVSLHIREGEIVGIAGLVGAGKSELCKTLFGALRMADGELLLRGRPVKLRTPADAVRRGIGLVPEERRKEGLLLEESVAWNLSLASLRRLSRLSFVRRRQTEVMAADIVRGLSLKTPSISQRVELLSGGNQQKVVVGKWLAGHCSVFLLDEPTKGVDVGAKAELFDLIRGLAEEGGSVLYASCENDELLALTDRIYVLFDGQVAAELITAETSEEELMHYAVGGGYPFRSQERGERNHGTDKEP